MTFRIKADWIPLLHRIRRREIEMIFADCPEKHFAAGLELGAGDGFQSRLISRYVVSLISTDYDRAILSTLPVEGIAYQVCDAEEIEVVFAGRKFDLIFSSSLLEHLPEPGRTLRAIHGLLAEGGLTIHVVPGTFWKMTHVLLHLPNRAVNILERLMQPGGMHALVRRLTRGKGRPTAPRGRDNNPKTDRPRRPLWARLVSPEPHGVSRGNMAEFAAFRRSRWLREFQEAGFEVIDVRRGPAASGYGFGFERTRRLLERLGFASEHAYVARRRGASR